MRRALIICLLVLLAFGCNPGLGTINVHIELDFPDMGGRRPRAHQTVYLLSNSIASAEMDEAFKKYMASTSPSGHFGNGNLTDTEKRSRVGFMSNDAGTTIWHRYIVKTVETDSQGEARFTSEGG